MGVSFCLFFWMRLLKDVEDLKPIVIVFKSVNLNNQSKQLMNLYSYLTNFKQIQGKNRDNVFTNNYHSNLKISLPAVSKGLPNN